jgi:hypothetical protein
MNAHVRLSPSRLRPLLRDAIGEQNLSPNTVQALISAIDNVLDAETEAERRDPSSDLRLILAIEDKIRVLYNDQDVDERTINEIATITARTLTAQHLDSIRNDQKYLAIVKDTIVLSILEIAKKLNSSRRSLRPVEWATLEVPNYEHDFPEDPPVIDHYPIGSLEHDAHLQGISSAMQEIVIVDALLSRASHEDLEEARLRARALATGSFEPEPTDLLMREILLRRDIAGAAEPVAA